MAKLYLECSAGISGDMTAAALIDLGADREAILRALESLPLEGFRVEISTVEKSGLAVLMFSSMGSMRIMTTIWNGSLAIRVPLGMRIIHPLLVSIVIATAL